MTSVDLEQQPQLLLAHKAMISLGHDEYWSRTMRDAATAARDHGVNLVFLGANAIYRQIRFAPSPLGPDRRQINYRSTADPISRTDPKLTTVNWPDPPVDEPESTLIGDMYKCNPVRADLVVTDPSAWIYAGTGLTAGQHVPGVVGTEYDGYVPGPGVPPNVQIMAHSPLRCRGRPDASDVTYYTAPSGAGVFATGSNWWVSKLSQPGPGSPYIPVIVTITDNVLAAFGAGPVGLVHPSVGNASQIVHGPVTAPVRES